jgi:hypothetical protein
VLPDNYLTSSGLDALHCKYFLRSSSTSAAFANIYAEDASRANNPSTLKP